jgi:protein involved in polysaccharide export with SLBB domain
MPRKKILIIFASLFMVINLSAQDNTQQQLLQSITGSGPSQYVLGQGDILTITVNLWGFVRKPGIYTVPSTYGLIDLLSSAGGPLPDSRLSDIRIIRKDEVVITVDVEKFIKTGNKDMIPPLQPGDTVIVSGSIRNVFAEVVGFMRDIAIILNAFLLYQSIYK